MYCDGNNLDQMGLIDKDIPNFFVTRLRVEDSVLKLEMGK